MNLQADRSFVGIHTLFDYYCPGQSDPVTLVWSNGIVNKPMAEVCVEKDTTRVRVAYTKTDGVVSNTKITIDTTVPYTAVNEWPVKWSFLYGASTYEILQTFSTG